MGGTPYSNIKPITSATSFLESSVITCRSTNPILVSSRVVLLVLYCSVRQSVRPHT